jgi:hypothetical protein
MQDQSLDRLIWWLSSDWVDEKGDVCKEIAKGVIYLADWISVYRSKFDPEPCKTDKDGYCQIM